MKFKILNLFSMKKLSGEKIIVTADKRTIILRFPEDEGFEKIVEKGIWEEGTTNFLSSVITKKDTLMDIGANIGWYTVLFAKYGGCVYSFEPHPEIFKRLLENCSANSATNVRTSKFALGDKVSDGNLKTFKNKSHGRASIFSLGYEVTESFPCRITTLDKYMEQEKISHVDYIKVDVEGAEAAVIAGAKKTLKSRHLPVWIIEYNEKTSKAAGYPPLYPFHKLLKCGYSFIRIENAWGKPQHSGLENFIHGDNIICYIPKVHVQIHI